MRITGGELRNRQLKIPDGIRPSQDMVRQAVYSSLAELVPGGRVLDLYAGSGALGLEAASRGAAAVLLVAGAGVAASHRPFRPGCGRRR